MGIAAWVQQYTLQYDLLRTNKYGSYCYYHLTLSRLVFFACASNYVHTRNKTTRNAIYLNPNVYKVNTIL